jgi:hypothetical protein
MRGIEFKMSTHNADAKSDEPLEAMVLRFRGADPARSVWSRPVARLVNSDQRSSRIRGMICSGMKTVSLQKILAIRCPRCGAAPGEKCELNTGQPRNEPHSDRRLNAAD